MQPLSPAHFTFVDVIAQLTDLGRALNQEFVWRRDPQRGVEDASLRVTVDMAGAMRKAALLYRNVRRLSSVASQGSFDLVARPLTGKVDTSSKLLSSPVWCVESRGAGGAHVQSSVPARAVALRFMGFGTFNEEHANAAVPEEEASEDEVNDDEHPSVAIEKASHELFRQSNAVVDYDASEEEEFKVKELGREKPGADIAREVWSAKEQDGTSVFTDESDKATSKG